ncbi:SpaA isopeptide-forming pilin-related protein [Candidatus Enterococcus murrayae]|uniref:Uncharacterized protein n=1 Tax=Candidatus Enterococcus murrayae TaxID=2815321 RepID=A0ABS3HK05_9ENTE|nr:SpaA isopeptide-forming pilin-related protein [Enterococcus sp. MJM16]MBO0453786.1 hypothetical protein [Enterococcus sp. MJM16]
MLRNIKLKQIVAVLLPVLLFVAIVFSLLNGKILKADDSEQPFAQVEIVNNTETKTESMVQEDEVQVELTGNETRLIRLPDSREYMVYQTDEAGQRIVMEEKSLGDLSESNTQQKVSQLKNEELNEPAIFHVSTGEDTGDTYLHLIKGKTLSITVKRQMENEVSIELFDSNDSKQKQKLVLFESNKEQAASSQEENNQSEVNTESKQKKAGASSTEIGNKIETKKTIKSLKELTETDYEAKDSLRTAIYFGESDEITQKSKVTKAASDPIIVRDAKLSIMTGTADFDANNDPGNDKSASNTIVRSFDQISYLLSFSVQNTTLTERYTDIRYRVKAEMPNAVELKDGIPRNNGEISNGAYIDTPAGDGSQISEGIMESTIGDTGQIFVPIILNVFGADHEEKIEPIITIEIVDARNKDTENIETFNKVYTADELSQLEIPVTTVSAKPSVGVKIIKGQDASGKVLLPEATASSKGTSTLDVGLITVLQPLAGRSDKDFRGTMFPKGEISYQVKGKGYYTKNNGPRTYLAESAYEPIQAVRYSPAALDRTTTSWKLTPYGSSSSEMSSNFRPELITTQLDAPNAETGAIYTSQPMGNFAEIGVYHSGTFTVSGSYNTDVKNSGYARTHNPYTYSMKGHKYGSDTKPFSSLEVLYRWDTKKWVDDYVNNNWTSCGVEFSVDKVTYDGITSDNNSSIECETLGQGDGQQAVSISKFGQFDENGDTGWGSILSLDIANSSITGNSGQAHVKQGQEIYLNGVIVSSGAKEIHQVLAFNASTFKYDTSREVSELRHLSRPSDSKSEMFGVPKNVANESPPLNFSNFDTQYALYNWYSSPEEAETNGKISAVYIKRTYSTGIGASRVTGIPVTVIGDVGSQDAKGKPNVLIGTSKYIIGTNQMIYRPLKNYNYTYTPTKFDSTGNTITNHSMSNGGYIAWGQSIFVDPFGITTSTDVKNPVYEGSEDVDVKVRGDLIGADSITYNGSLNTTLPKGVSYKPDTSKDASGKKIGEPTITNNPDGTTTLKWVFTDMIINKGIEVNFKVTNKISDISFNAEGQSEKLNVTTIGEMWLKNDSTKKDTSTEASRSSNDSYILKLNQKVTLSKDVDKKIIEVGDKDPVGEENTITYRVTLENEKTSTISHVWLKDVLPYDGDSRGTIFKGSYTVEEIKVDSTSKVDIAYSKNFLDENADPKDITGGTAYKPGTTPASEIKDAKSVWLHAPSMAIGEKIILTIKIKPTGQQPKDVLVNNAIMNSDIDLLVQSQPVATHVYGRDLTGYVWYDDNYNGLIDSSETPVGNIPVKLYRTSQKDSSYVKQLVKESLTGEKFIDDSGDSLIETGSDGKYKFENLPEGDYLAEFMIGDIVVTKKIVIVTKQLIGSDPKLNSKADPDNFKTPEYNHPELNDLPTLLTGTDKVHHVTDVNAGLTRLSKIRLFKYEEGTVIDVDGNGTLEPEEIEASTTNALEGAEFQLYKGKKDDPDTIKDENKIGSPVKTGSDGWLEYGSLPPGFYTIVETKAPAGFELLKNPIEVEVPTYNYIAIVHVPDKGQTKLPFTGGTKAMRIILIASACLLVIGMTGVFLHFRPIKGRGGN